jgi:hypothetical protein
MRDISRYFDIINSTVRHSPAVDYEIGYKESEGGVGTVTATLWFADESKLEFKEVILIRAERLIKLGYSYQYMQDDKTVFRYDNTAHHRRVESFPHHKHVGRKVVAALEPTLKQVLEEIAAIIETG